MSSMIEGGVCPSDIPRTWLLKYCLRDVVLTGMLFRQQLREMEGTALLPVVWSRCFVVPALTDIEKRGLMLDEEKVKQTYNELNTELMVVLKRLD